MRISKIYIPLWGINTKPEDQNKIIFIFPLEGKLYRIVSKTAPGDNITRYSSVMNLLLSGKLEEIEKGYDPGKDWDNIGGYTISDGSLKQLVEHYGLG